jgi:hypothetical protein
MTAARSVNIAKLRSGADLGVVAEVNARGAVCGAEFQFTLVVGEIVKRAAMCSQNIGSDEHFEWQIVDDAKLVPQNDSANRDGQGREPFQLEWFSVATNNAHFAWTAYRWLKQQSIEEDFVD